MYGHVRAAIDEPVAAIVESVIQCLGMSPPELAQDLIVNGVKLVEARGTFLDSNTLELKHKDMQSAWFPDGPFSVLRPFYFGFTPFIGQPDRFYLPIATADGLV